MRVFLEQLFRNGQITVPPVGVELKFDADAERWVMKFDRAARLALPGAAPALDFAAAAWAARRQANACRLAIARELRRFSPFCGLLTAAEIAATYLRAVLDGQRKVS